MTDCAVLDISAGFGYFKPPHIADGFPGPCKGIFDGFLKSVGRGTDQLNFFVNMIRHVCIISSGTLRKQQKADLALIRWQGHRPLNFVTARRRSTICFTNGASFRHPRRVRKLAATSLLLLAVFSFACAQDQESKLVDRLLRPDMTLQNTAQKKSFIAAGGTSTNKQATVGTFYVQEKSNSKGFSGTRGFSAQQFNSQSFPHTRSASGISSQQAIGKSRPAYATRTARGTRDAPQSDKKIASHSYAENRPFLDQGKSQKSLNRQNAPLTIEQVRELLNKNK